MITLSLSFRGIRSYKEMTLNISFMGWGWGQSGDDAIDLAKLQIIPTSDSEQYCLLKIANNTVC